MINKQSKIPAFAGMTKKGGWQQYLWVGILLLLVGGALMYRTKPASLPQGPQADSGSYASLIPGRFVTPIVDGLGLITRIKLTPDNQLMFVAALTGEVWVLERAGQEWHKQTEPLYKVEHEMDVAGENGLTGLIVSSDYANNHAIFLNYPQKQANGQGENQILRLTVERQDDRYIGVNPTVIFRGNISVLGAHQIQGGFSLMREGKPHLLFAIGDAYHPAYAKDLTKEAGKIMLIGEDGSDPLGERPYPKYPKIQAIGIRNAYDISLDPSDALSVYFTDNGPESNDRLIQARIFDGRRYDFAWDRTAASLLKPLINGRVDESLILYRWDVTVSPVDILATQSDIYINIFSSNRYPNKELVTLVGGDAHLGGYQLNVMVRRPAEAAGGNLLGLAAGSDGSIYFGDMQDGIVYRLWPRK